MMLAVLWSFIFLVGSVQGVEVCCTNDPPWNGIVNTVCDLAPFLPLPFNIRYLMFSRKNPNDFIVLNFTDSSVCDPNLNSTKKIHFIVHGFLDYGEDEWLSDMSKAIIKVEDSYSICVDWSEGSQTTYNQAINNVPVVGKDLASVITKLVNCGFSVSDIHIIGHSLGAQIAGEVGKQIPGIGRITGLDPAGPCYDGTPPEDRLDPSDAVIVVAIHTNACQLVPCGGLGTTQQVGDVDILPNGGKTMPGCEQINVPDITEDIVTIIEDIYTYDQICSHLQSIHYFTESIINPEGFISFLSPSYSAFQSGVGFPCSSGSCIVMGLNTVPLPGVPPGQQIFYVNTGVYPPFARWRYKVTALMTGSRSVLGSVHASLSGVNGNTGLHEICSGIITPGMQCSGFIDVELYPGYINSVTLVWKKSIIDLLPAEMGADKVDVQFGKDGTIYKFCGSGTVKADKPLVINSC